MKKKYSYIKKFYYILKFQSILNNKFDTLCTDKNYMDYFPRWTYENLWWILNMRKIREHE